MLEIRAPKGEAATSAGSAARVIYATLAAEFEASFWNEVNRGSRIELPTGQSVSLAELTPQHFDDLILQPTDSKLNTCQLEHRSV